MTAGTTRGTRRGDPPKDRAARRKALRHLVGLRDALQAAREKLARLEREGAGPQAKGKTAALMTKLAVQLAKAEDVVKPGKGAGLQWSDL